MLQSRSFRLDGNVCLDGLRILAVNAILAFLCIVSFFGTLAIVTGLNERAHAGGVAASGDIPFPYLSLLAAYAVVYLVVWILLARRLPTSGRAHMFTTCIGASPLFALSILGYAVAVLEFIVDMMYDDFFPVAGIYIFGFLATVVLLAGSASVTVIYFGSRRGIA